MYKDLKILPLIFKTEDLAPPSGITLNKTLWITVLKSLDRTFDKLICKILVVELHQLKKQTTDHEALQRAIYSEGYLQERLKNHYSTEWASLHAILKNTKTQFDLLLNRLHADRADLDHAFNICTQDELLDIEWGVSDIHNAGEQVHILTFTSRKLVYKPRSGAMLIAYNQFLEKINPEITYPHLIQTTLDRNDYHWVQFIPHTKCQSLFEIERYYYRLGSLMAVSYGLCATDFHYENLIASGEYPVLIDLDSLIEPTADQSNPNQGTGSVISTGLLPFQMWNESTKSFSDISGCSTNIKLISKMLSLCTEQSHSWSLKSSESATYPKNHPQIERPIHHFLNSIENGFIETYLTFLRFKKNPDWKAEDFLMNFQNLPTRFMNRNTMEYEAARNGQLHPSVCLDPKLKETYFHGFFQIPNFFKNHQDLVLDEVDTLKKFAIPYYWSNTSSKDLFRKNNSTQEVTINFFEQSGFERLKHRWNKKINRIDLFRQLWFIRSSLFLTSENVDSLYWNPLDWQTIAILFRCLSGKNTNHDSYQWVTINFPDKQILSLPLHSLKNREDLIELLNAMSYQPDVNQAADVFIWNSIFLKDSSSEEHSTNSDIKQSLFLEFFNADEVAKLNQSTLSLTMIAKLLRHMNERPQFENEVRKLFNKQFSIDLENSHNLLTPEHHGGIWLLFAFSLVINGMNENIIFRRPACLN